MLSEQTCLVDYHVWHAPNAGIGFIWWEGEMYKTIQTLSWLLGKANEIQDKLILFLKREQDLKKSQRSTENKN